MPEAGTQKVAQLKMISPQFVVPDVKVAAEYYRDVLGFKVLGYFYHPPVYSIVQRDNVDIHFGKVDEGHSVEPNIGRRSGSMDAYIWVTDVAPRDTSSACSALSLKDQSRRFTSAMKLWCKTLLVSV